ncbi:MAG: CBS domain-containing protein [Candidatus Altiarchaeales archaeon]|nr:CBS domain-containing protein [Candidatus Altiarchaeota archaeon]MBU4341844.1 CBS domain-containing protein [Candidatus Altiarchaeota archaeon]MBU4406286.1 CBS domain-containing protein [Candidatus Altiarchaeota archaeon]MBU4437708.1 CBS domain-containing protein [Candidatus Altiarchaeota archaeon]MCG2782677.1 CBS domain-containing protein [Candidatus Altiarchaeales archaeon]
MRIREVMTRGTINIGGEATVMEAIEKMHDCRVGALVVDNSAIVTRRDVLAKVIAPGRNPAEVKVSEIMSDSLVTVHPDATVEDMAKIIHKREIGKFPVADDNGIVGFVSSGDVLKAVVLECQD